MVGVVLCFGLTCPVAVSAIAFTREAEVRAYSLGLKLKLWLV
jgi:hypothetical protein